MQNDLKPLYGLQPEDIHFLADLVERKEISVKGSKATKVDKVAKLPSLQAVGNRERLMRVMKNELMNHFKKFELPSRKSTYVMYSREDWDDFAKEKSITRAELESWLDKAYATTVGKKWMDDRNRNLNKTSDPKDCPDVVKAMWDAHIYATNQASVAADIQSKFAGKYKCVILDKLRPELTGLLASEDVFQWRGGGKTHLFFYFLFDKQEDRSVKPDLLDEVRLRCIFEPLEAAEPNGGSFARSGGVIFTDAMGFHAVVSHLETRLRKSKQKVWNWHVVHYVPSCEDGFPEPRIGTSYMVYIIFCFGNVGNAANKRLLQGLLQREDGHGSCILGQRHHRDNYLMEADWSPHDKAGRAFHSLSGALEREHGSYECQRHSPLHPPWAGELLFPILYAFDSRYFV